MDKKELWIIANWKSNKDIQEALTWLDEVGPKLERRPNVKVVVCPTFTAIEEVKKRIMVNNYPLLVGAQDLSPFENGPYTGEESAKILAELVDLAILGHSERRNNFGETDNMVEEKVEQAKKYQIIPLVCVQDQHTPIPKQAEIVAYEPIFAIGTGQPDSPNNAQVVAVSIKSQTNAPVLYGGSVNATNAKAFMQQPDISGLLIGGASLDPEQFLQILAVAYLM